MIKDIKSKDGMNEIYLNCLLLFNLIVQTTITNTKNIKILPKILIKIKITLPNVTDTRREGLNKKLILFLFLKFPLHNSFLASPISTKLFKIVYSINIYILPCKLDLCTMWNRTILSIY